MKLEKARRVRNYFRAVSLKKSRRSEHSEESPGYLEMSRVARHDVALDRLTIFNGTTVEIIYFKDGLTSDIVHNTFDLF